MIDFPEPNNVQNPHDPLRRDWHRVTYALSDGESVKVGLSSPAQIESRIAVLQVGNARELVLLGMVRGNRESSIHRQLSNEHVRGEWFRLTAATRAVLQVEGLLEVR